MISYIKTGRLFFQGFLIYRDLRKYLNHSFAADLQFPAELSREYFYHSTYYNRTRQYMHANHFFGELLCLLRGEKMKEPEYEKFALLSAIAPIFDDFFEKNYQLNHIFQLLQLPKTTPPQNAAEELAVHCLLLILEKTPDSEHFQETAVRLFHAQNLSKNQPEKLSHEQLLENSLNKGGFSGLMYSLLLNGQKNPEFEKLGFLLGGFGQLMDDIFDIYDDAQSGIQTFANQSETIEKLRDIAENQHQQILATAKPLAIDERAYQQFVHVLIVFGSIVELAILQFEKLEKKHGVRPSNCLAIARENWIVDMENPLNMVRLFILAAQRLQSMQ